MPCHIKHLSIFFGLDKSRCKWSTTKTEGRETDRKRDMERGVGFLWNTFGASSLLVSASRNKSPYSNAPWRRHDIKGEIGEIRVCTNRTCRRQGSLQTLETLSGLAPPNVTVKSCGCLGRCGAGPNLAALRDDGGGVILVGHCGTAARSAEIMMGLFCGHDSDDTAAKTSLEALALRKRAETESEEGNFSQAELLLSRVHSFLFSGLDELE